MVMTPVVRMRNMAERFGEGDHDVRVADGERRDELGQLGRQLNQMAEQIQNYTHGLENLVEERTQELAESNLMLRQANSRLEALARTDELTGLCNRRHFMTQLGFEVTRGRRTVHQFTLIMLDLDHFKHYNDTNGHPMGDTLLRSFSQLLVQTLRQTDLIGRYGGEEFGCILIDTDSGGAEVFAERLRQAVEECTVSYQQAEIQFTISLGIAELIKPMRSHNEWLEASDMALYSAKQAGRNNVKVAAIG